MVLVFFVLLLLWPKQSWGETPDWRARYEELKKLAATEFSGVSVGDGVTIAPTIGSNVHGILLEIGSNTVVLSVDGKPQPFERRKLTPKSRVKLFVEDYAHQRAVIRLRQEQSEWEARHAALSQQAINPSAVTAIETRENSLATTGDSLAWVTDWEAFGLLVDFPWWRREHLGRTVTWEGVVTAIEEPKIAGDERLIRLAMKPITVGSGSDRAEICQLTLAPNADEWQTWQSVPVGSQVTFSTKLGGNNLLTMDMLLLLHGMGPNAGKLFAAISTTGGKCLKGSGGEKSSSQPLANTNSLVSVPASVAPPEQAHGESQIAPLAGSDLPSASSAKPYTYDNAIAAIEKDISNATGKRQESLSLLLPRLKEIKSNRDVNAKDANGVTVLMSAAGLKLYDTAKLLIAEGADVNAKDNDDWTPLMWAAINADTATAEMLISKGSDVNMKAKDGQTALDYASQGQNVVAIQGGMALVEPAMGDLLKKHMK